MSLIADALKKADTSPAALPPSPKASPRGWIYLGIGACAFLVTMGIRSALHPADSSPPRRSRPAVTAANLETPAPRGLNLLRAAEGQWRLNGIVKGGPGKPLALINGQVVEEGGTIQGAQLVRVASDEVELSTETGQTRTLKLR